MHNLKEQLIGAEHLIPEVLQYIESQNLWNIWVPRKFRELEKKFSEGLEILQNLARIDGSLGWTVTLCSGANYFVGNLKPEAATKIFKSGTAVCFGGSGAVCGIAKREGNNYRISGKWSYATGSSYLTHFTLNAKIVENGNILKNSDGSDLVRSFIVPKKQVKIIKDWHTMGLKATITNSFEINNQLISENYMFLYNTFYQPQAIFKIPFAIFADLTLWVNYIGMATHFIDECKELGKYKFIKNLEQTIGHQQNSVKSIALDIENKTTQSIEITENQTKEIHQTSSTSVAQISKELIDVYPNLGMKACAIGTSLNQIFCDYFTATQHHNFSKR